MPFETHLKRGHPIIFGLLIFFSFVEMIQTAVLVASFNRNDDPPSGSVEDRTRFLLFASLWTMFFGAVYLIGFMKAAASFLFSIASHAAFLFLSWLFWLAGAAALTDALGGGLDCNSFEGGRCHQLNSAIAFAWINFILATFALAAVIFTGARSARNGNGFGGALSA